MRKQQKKYFLESSCFFKIYYNIFKYFLNVLEKSHICQKEDDVPVDFFNHFTSFNF